MQVSRPLPALCVNVCVCVRHCLSVYSVTWGRVCRSWERWLRRKQVLPSEGTTGCPRWHQLDTRRHGYVTGTWGRFMPLCIRASVGITDLYKERKRTSSTPTSLSKQHLVLDEHFFFSNTVELNCWLRANWGINLQTTTSYRLWGNVHLEYMLNTPEQQASDTDTGH